MSLDVTINPEPVVDEPKTKLNVTINDTTKKIYEFKLNLRRALNGDLMIFDHNDIDIIVMTEKNKVVAFAKDLMTEVVYGAESRLFEFLRTKGIIAHDSIQGGNVYGSLEGTILESKELDAIKATIYEISQWMKEERPYFESIEGHEEMMNDYLLDPDEENSTELGEVPHEDEKGGILQRGMFAPYLYGRYTY
jgi:hypothetical protein